MRLPEPGGVLEERFEVLMHKLMTRKRPIEASELVVLQWELRTILLDSECQQTEEAKTR